MEMVVISTLILFLCVFFKIKIWSFIHRCIMDDLFVCQISGGATYRDIMQQELITLLCMSDRTHSQLSDAMPDRCGHIVDHSADFEEILSRVI